MKRRLGISITFLLIALSSVCQNTYPKKIVNNKDTFVIFRNTQVVDIYKQLVLRDKLLEDNILLDKRASICDTALDACEDAISYGKIIIENKDKEISVYKNKLNKAMVENSKLINSNKTYKVVAYSVGTMAILEILFFLIK